MIETESIILKPLTYEQLVKYIKCDGSLDEELGLKKTFRNISPELQEALQETILPGVADESRNSLYATIWTAISKADNRMVGDICFVGDPNPEGEVEIGYGTYEAFRGCGFMTEIVATMVEWARAQPGIKAIVASTEKTNQASFKVLQKNNFVKTGETGELFNWRLDIDV